MNGKKRSHASLEVLGTEQKPKRRSDRRHESYSIAGPSTNTTRLPTSMRQLLPKPAFTCTPPEEDPSVNFEVQVVHDQLPRDQQSSGELQPSTTLSQEGTLLQDPVMITTPPLTADESASIPADPDFPHTTNPRGGGSQVRFAPVSDIDAHTAAVFRNETAALNLFDQFSPHSPTAWGHCIFCDGLWRSHTESVMGLLRPPGVGTAGYGADTTIPTWNIFRSYFAFQDHAERCHGWRIRE